MHLYVQNILQRILNADFGLDQLIFDTLFATYKVYNFTPVVFDLLMKTSTQPNMTETAIKIFGLKIIYGFLPALETYNILPSALLRANDMDNFWLICAKMLQFKVISNIYTFNIMIISLCKEGKLKKENEVLEDTEET